MHSVYIVYSVFVMYILAIHVQNQAEYDRMNKQQVYAQCIYSVQCICDVYIGYIQNVAEYDCMNKQQVYAQCIYSV